MCGRVMGRKEGRQTYGNGRLIDESDKLAKVFQVGKSMAFQLVIGQFGASFQPYTGIVDGIDEGGWCPMLFQKIVGLGESAAKIEPCGMGLLLQTLLKHLVKAAVYQLIVGLEGRRSLQFLRSEEHTSELQSRQY